MSVTLSHIAKSYGAVKVLPPLSLDIAKGELIALLGPSGCGKTTTLRIIAGLELPDAGTVHIDGIDVTKLPPEKRGLGMVFQQYAVWPHRTVTANVAYPLERAGVAAGEIGARVRDALAMVHLDKLGDRKPGQLSGGQLQRVALARALVGRPRVLLLDEPLSNLDALLREEMRAEIRALQRRLSITTVLVTHDQAEALAIADRVAVLSAGHVEQLAPPMQVYREPATAFVARFVGGGNVIPARNEGGTLHIGDGGAGNAGGAGASMAAPAGSPAGAVVIVVRPEDVRPDPAGHEMTVLDSLYLGDRTEVRLEWAGVPLRAVLPAAEAEALRPETRTRASFARVRILPAG